MRRFPAFVVPNTPVNLPLRRSAAPSREAASRRILIVRTTANGDILMGTPLLAALRDAYPDAHLTWMAEYRDREAIDANPFIDEILLWDTAYWKRMTRAGLFPLWWLRWQKMRGLLRTRPFDILVSFQPEDWPALARDSGADIRIGVFDTFREYHRQKATSRRARLYTRAFVHEEHPPHRVEQYLLPLQALRLPVPENPKMTIGYTAEDECTADEYIMHELDGKRFIVIAPLTGWPSRNWPEARYTAVADALARETNGEIVLVAGGSENDRATLGRIADQMTTKPHLAAGRFGFRGLAALIARAALVVSGDTGPMHVAAAVGTPYVALFGPTPVERFAPRGAGGIALFHPVPCGPCHQKVCPRTGDDHQICLKRITVEEVAGAARRFLPKSVCASWPGND